MVHMLCLLKCLSMIGGTNERAEDRKDHGIYRRSILVNSDYNSCFPFPVIVRILIDIFSLSRHRSHLYQCIGFWNEQQIF